MNVGGAEVLCFDVVAWAEMMREVGCKVALEVVEGVPLDVLGGVAGMLGGGFGGGGGGGVGGFWGGEGGG